MRPGRTIEHDEPEDAPAERADDRHQTSEPLRGPQFESSALQPDFRSFWNSSIFVHAPIGSWT